MCQAYQFQLVSLTGLHLLFQPLLSLMLFTHSALPRHSFLIIQPPLPPLLSLRNLLCWWRIYLRTLLPRSQVRPSKEIHSHWERNLTPKRVSCQRWRICCVGLEHGLNAMSFMIAAGCFVATVCWKQTNGEDIGTRNMIETIVNIATIMVTPTLVFCLSPICIYIFVKSKYKLNWFQNYPFQMVMNTLI